MAKQSTTTRPTEPARPNVGAWRFIPPMHYPDNGGLRGIDAKMPFDRVAEYDDKSNVLHTVFTVAPDKDATTAYVVTTDFNMPKGTPRAAALWAGRALVVDLQGRIRSAMTGKKADNAEGRRRAYTAATWSRVDVVEPDMNAADPVKQHAADVNAMKRTIATMERTKVAPAMLASMRAALADLVANAPKPA